MGPQVDKSELPHDSWFWCDSVPYTFDYSKDVDGEKLHGKRRHRSEDICADPWEDRVHFPWGDSSSLFVHIAPNFLHCMRSKQSSEVIFTVEPHIDVSLKSWFTKYLGSWVCFIVR